MKRSGFKRRAPKGDRTGDVVTLAALREVAKKQLVGYIPQPNARMAALLQAAAPKPVPPKIDKRVRKRQALRDAANGEDCTVRIFGCINARDTCVLAHWPGLDADRGMGMKALDLAGAIACAHCHDIVDMRKKPPVTVTRQEVELCFFRGHLRTLVRWAQKGLL
jgi:hypothetical protein